MSPKIDTLPLHLVLTMMNWLCSESVWRIANPESGNSRKPSGSSNPENGTTQSPNPNPFASAPPHHAKKQEPKTKKPPEAQKPKRTKPVADAEQLLEGLLNLERSLAPEKHLKPKKPRPSAEPSPSPQSQKFHQGKPSARPFAEHRKANSGESKEEFAQKKAAYDAYLPLFQDPAFVEAIQQEALQRSMQMLKGVSIYQESVPSRKEAPHQILWKRGSASLLDYGGSSDAPAVLCIPSLINRSYILDLYPERSVMRFFKDSGYRPMLLDWGAPGSHERHFNCAEYVYDLALDALREVRRNHKGPIILLGYCMGGVFALALAQLEAFYVDGLILLATPWNFHHEGQPPLRLDAATIKQIEQMIAQSETVPSAWVQTMFQMINPWHFQEKFSKLANMKKEEQRHFLAVEGWVNDGVDLTRKVARECLIDWPVHNALAAGKWRVGGWKIDPARITCPTLISAPSDDKIVPLYSSLPLADLIPNTSLITPKTGHVSMIVGSKARATCWQPMARWIRSVVASTN